MKPPFGNISGPARRLLPPRIAALLRGIGRIADEHHDRAFAVGGCVRDIILKRPTLDIDITVEGDGHRTAREAAGAFGATSVFHHRFLTAVLAFPDGFTLDVATARRERYTAPASLPEVEPSHIEDDLVRRDFTINALAFDLSPGRYGDVLDVSSGLEDLAKGVVRVFHGRSMHDDPTRAFRAARFSGRYGFTIDADTGDLMRSSVRDGCVTLLSGERLMKELRLILEEDRPGRSLAILSQYGLLSQIHPDLRWGPPEERAFKNLTGQDRGAIETRGAGFVLLTRRLGPRARNGMTARLSLPALWREWLEEGGRLFQETLPHVHPPLGPAEISDLLGPYRRLEPLVAGAAASSGWAKKALTRYLREWREVRPLLTGDDLKRMGMEPGPVYQKVLKGLLRARLEGRVRTRRDEMACVKEIIDARGTG